MENLKYSKAVWLINNTKISDKQIADFCELHELETRHLRTQNLSKRYKNEFDLVKFEYLTTEEIEKAELDPDKPLPKRKIKKK